MTAKEDLAWEREFFVCWLETGGRNATQFEEGARIEGDHPGALVTTGVLEKLMVLTVPDIAIIDGPGYRMSYGEATKCAPEASVLIGQRSRNGRMGLGNGAELAAATGEDRSRGRGCIVVGVRESRIQGEGSQGTDGL